MELEGGYINLCYGHSLRLNPGVILIGSSFVKINEGRQSGKVARG